MSTPYHPTLHTCTVPQPTLYTTALSHTIYNLHCPSPSFCTICTVPAPLAWYNLGTVPSLACTTAPSHLLPAHPHRPIMPAQICTVPAHCSAQPHCPPPSAQLHRPSHCSHNSTVQTLFHNCTVPTTASTPALSQHCLHNLHRPQSQPHPHRPTLSHNCNRPSHCRKTAPSQSLPHNRTVPVTALHNLHRPWAPPSVSSAPVSSHLAQSAPPAHSCTIHLPQSLSQSAPYFPSLFSTTCNPITVAHALSHCLYLHRLPAHSLSLTLLCTPVLVLVIVCTPALGSPVTGLHNLHRVPSSLLSHLHRPNTASTSAPSPVTTAHLHRSQLHSSTTRTVPVTSRTTCTVPVTGLHNQHRPQPTVCTTAPSQPTVCTSAPSPVTVCAICTVPGHCSCNCTVPTVEVQSAPSQSAVHTCTVSVTARHTCTGSQSLLPTPATSTARWLQHPHRPQSTPAHLHRPNQWLHNLHRPQITVCTTATPSLGHCSKQPSNRPQPVQTTAPSQLHCPHPQRPHLPSAQSHRPSSPSAQLHRPHYRLTHLHRPLPVQLHRPQPLLLHLYSL
ncbi:mucin-12-like [Homarus americanus]|uniref:mucin-12-like n=1 Tax=Homarus americanus TaxID=6706 RepID=UPI001C485A64|nr:mucin-12-like [Homarus americanus]